MATVCKYYIECINVCDTENLKKDFNLNHYVVEECVGMDKCCYYKKINAETKAKEGTPIKEIAEKMVEGIQRTIEMPCDNSINSVECGNVSLKSTSYFEDITQEMFELYQVKNKNYGNSFSEQFKDYGMTSVCIRLDDKIRRLKSLNKQGAEGTSDESIRDTLIDISNYAVMAIMELDGFKKVEEDNIKEFKFEMGE